MDAATRTGLIEINRSFYAQHAQEFSSTRDHAWPGWHQTLRALPTRQTRDVLDAGCGNGRFAAFLAEYAPETQYLGIDSSDALLECAAARALPASRFRFERSDLLAALEAGPGNAGDEPRRDLVVLFGVLHHVPSFELRVQLVSELASRLARGGVIAMTIWRFGASERFGDRVVPWEAWNATTAQPIDPTQLEPGDYLLRWGAESTNSDVGEQPARHSPARYCPARYCHYADAAETERLVDAACSGPHSLSRLASFEADGRGNKLNHYVLLQRDD